MLPKPGFTRSLKHERTLAEIVSEGGTLRRRDILFVIRQLCLRLERTADDPERRGNPRIHPRNVIVAANGEIRFADRDLPLAVMEAWLPPELDRSDPCPPGSEVYALGMLMLYMATGKEHKTDAEAFVRNRSLLSLIEGCTAFDPGERFRDCTEVLEAVRQAEGRGRLLLKWLFALLALGLLAGLVYHGWREGSRRAPWPASGRVLSPAMPAAMSRASRMRRDLTSAGRPLTPRTATSPAILPPWAAPLQPAARRLCLCCWRERSSRWIRTRRRPRS